MRDRERSRGGSRKSGGGVREWTGRGGGSGCVGRGRGPGRLHSAAPFVRMASSSRLVSPRSNAQRSSARRPQPSSLAGAHGVRDHHARARVRRDDRDLQRRARGAAGGAAVSRSVVAHVPARRDATRDAAAVSAQRARRRVARRRLVRVQRHRRRHRRAVVQPRRERRGGARAGRDERRRVLSPARRVDDGRAVLRRARGGVAGVAGRRARRTICGRGSSARTRASSARRSCSTSRRSRSSASQRADSRACPTRRSCGCRSGSRTVCTGRTTREMRQYRWLSAVARLRPGVTEERARDADGARVRRPAADVPEGQRAPRVHRRVARGHVLRRAAPPALVAAGGRRLRAADRVREHREPAAGARGGAPARDGRARGVRRRTRASRAAMVRRESRARGRRDDRRAGAGGLGRAGDRAAPAPCRSRRSATPASTSGCCCSRSSSRPAVRSCSERRRRGSRRACRPRTA